MPAGRRQDRVPPFPSWFRALDTIHRATRSPLPLVVDAAVFVACGLVAGAPAEHAAGLALALVCALHVAGAYADRSSLETQGTLWFVSASVTPSAITILAAVALAQIFGWQTQRTMLVGAMGLAGMVATRGITSLMLNLCRRRGIGLQRTLIIGHGRHACMLANKLARYPGAGLLPVAMLPVGGGAGYSRYLPGFPSAAALSVAIEEADARHVVLAPECMDEAILDCAKGIDRVDVTFSVLRPVSEIFLHPRMVTQVGGLPLIPLGRIACGRTALPGKRAFDLVVASLLMVVLSPLLATVALAIKLSDRGPVIYRQDRVGQGGKVFKMLKFRSMVQDADRLVIDLRDQNVNDGLLFKIEDDPRITPVGRVIRRLAIDELPQLWNVIRGEMSLVGPRPLPVNPEDFNGIESKRHAVPPGITGYWQVAGDHALTYSEMVKLDLAYVDKWSLGVDVNLLFRTIPALIHRRGPS